MGTKSQSRACDQRVHLKPLGAKRASKGNRHEMRVADALAKGKMTLNRILLGMFLMLLFVTPACAETWYLMAPDQKVMSEPEAATKVGRGAIVGPIHVTSTAEFPSQQKCEATRPRLIDDWRRRNVMTRGSWTRHGFNDPSDFILCISTRDPRLALGPYHIAGIHDVRSMDLWLPAKRTR